MSFFESASLLYKGIPLPKVPGLVPLASQVRPIDIFSCFVRTHAAALAGALKYWSHNILHEGQFASKGGLVPALARVSWSAELSASKGCSVIAVSLDSQKMLKQLNTLHALIAARIATFCGLSEQNAADMAVPILGAYGYWKLPFQGAPLFFRNTRGLPRELSTSVLLAEISVCPLLWRLSSALGGAVTLVACIDDIHVLSMSKDALVRALSIVKEFEQDFLLRLFLEKTKVWGVLLPMKPWRLQRRIISRPPSVLKRLGENGRPNLEHAWTMQENIDDMKSALRDWTKN